MRRLLPILILCASALPGLALGPVDGEAGVLYWKHTETLTIGPDSADQDGDAGAVHAEVWFLDRWGVRGAYWKSSPDTDAAGGDINSVHAELAFKLIAPTENTFVAADLGWRRIELGDFDTGGVRAGLQARFGFAGFVYAFGEVGWTPSMSDTGSLREVESKDAQAGVSFEPFPFLSLRAGYRFERIDFESSGAAGEIETKGPFAGLGIHW